MADIPEGYKNVPEEDQKKAKVFFDYGRSAAGTGNYDYAIEMFLQGLALDPDATAAHQELRDISLKRKAAGNKDLGFIDKMKLNKSGKTELETMLNAEKLMSYDPGNTDRMVSVLQAALRGGYYDTVMWMGPILQRANNDAKSPNFNQFIVLKDAYKSLKQWKLASDACAFAMKLRPDEMDLATEMKNLGAQHTMTQGKYDSSGSFRDSVKDMAGQAKLMASDKDVRNVDVMKQIILDAEAEHLKDPNDQAKLTKLVEALVKTETPEYENRAMELLDQAYQRTRQFRFRHNMGKIVFTQLARMDRTLRENVRSNPNDANALNEYKAFYQEKLEKELAELQLWVENYPTETSYRFEMAKRMFELKHYGEAIPVFQQVRSDPKYRVEAGIYLGRSFLQAEFLDEAIDTLKGIIDDYQLKGDSRSKDMYYWYARAQEQKGQGQDAVKSYSQVAMMEFNYRDVQARIKRLRAAS